MGWLDDVAEEADERPGAVADRIDDVVVGLDDEDPETRNLAARALSKAASADPGAVEGAFGDVAARFEEEPHEAVKYNH